MPVFVGGIETRAVSRGLVSNVHTKTDTTGDTYLAMMMAAGDLPMAGLWRREDEERELRLRPRATAGEGLRGSSK